MGNHSLKIKFESGGKCYEKEKETKPDHGGGNSGGGAWTGNPGMGGATQKAKKKMPKSDFAGGGSVIPGGSTRKTKTGRKKRGKKKEVVTCDCDGGRGFLIADNWNTRCQTDDAWCHAYLHGLLEKGGSAKEKARIYQLLFGHPPNPGVLPEVTRGKIQSACAGSPLKCSQLMDEALAGEEVKSLKRDGWLRKDLQNKALWIPVTVSAGIIILILAFLACYFCKKAKSTKKTKSFSRSDKSALKTFKSRRKSTRISTGASGYKLASGSKYSARKLSARSKSRANRKATLKTKLSSAAGKSRRTSGLSKSRTSTMSRGKGSRKGTNK